MATNPRWKNGSLRRGYRNRFMAMGLPCAICGRPIHYDEPSDHAHPLSFVIDEIRPVSRYREFGYPSRAAAANDWDNLQPAHYICNQKKGALAPGETRKDRVTGLISLPDGDW